MDRYAFMCLRKAPYYIKGIAGTGQAMEPPCACPYLLGSSATPSNIIEGYELPSITGTEYHPSRSILLIGNRAGARTFLEGLLAWGTCYYIPVVVRVLGALLTFSAGV